MALLSPVARAGIDQKVPRRMSSAPRRGTDHRGEMGVAGKKAEHEYYGRVNHSRSSFSGTIEFHVVPLKADEPVLLAIDLQFGRSRPLISQIIAPRAVLSPMGNGRARITTCHADMAWWCMPGNALV